MLVSFTVGNFRSFGDEETLSMVASNRIRDHHSDHLVPIPGTPNELVTTALIYGANAAGKTNLCEAIAFAQECITSGTIPDYQTFRFRPDIAAKPTTCEFRFLLDNDMFIYGFDIRDGQIVSEWLSQKRGDSEPVIFERGQEGKTSIGPGISPLSEVDPKLKSVLKILTELPLKPNQLFLNRVDSVPDDVQGTTFRKVINWLTKEISVLRPHHRDSGLIERLEQDDRLRSLAASFLSYVDTGVNELAVNTTNRDCADHERVLVDFMKRTSAPFYTGDTELSLVPYQPEKICERQLRTHHVVSDKQYVMPFSSESAGTQQLLHFMPILFPQDGGPSTVAIDELDRSLHPILCWEFIELFSGIAAPSRRQLIVTTHESHLLSQDLLRRDEYWFAQKDEKQQTRLTSLSDFKIRKDLQVSKGYLNGRFGGVPLVNDLEDMRELLSSWSQ